MIHQSSTVNFGYSFGISYLIAVDRGVLFVVLEGDDVRWCLYTLT